MAAQKKRSNEHAKCEPSIEAGLAAFQGLRSASEERNQSLAKLVAPYCDGIREALERGVSKRAVLGTLNRLIGHSINARKLDELLGGGTMRGKSRGGASSLFGVSAKPAASNGEAT